MLSYYYKETIPDFVSANRDSIIGIISSANQFDSARTQNKSWIEQIALLQEVLNGLDGTIIFEYTIPRMGRRVDCLAIIKNIVFVLEFKVGEPEYHNADIEQVWDYALDLTNFHGPSRDATLIPVLVATEARSIVAEITMTSHNDGLSFPVCANKSDLRNVIDQSLKFFGTDNPINADDYLSGSYNPTPTIIEAAVSLYNTHSVDEITRNDAEAENLTKTCEIVDSIIASAKEHRNKAIVFVTGVPGAGKTLVGLKVATNQMEQEHAATAVYLSGNKPLVDILQEALARDRILRDRANGLSITKGEAKASVKTFIQIIHHYRDAYLIDKKAPVDHVAIFDEAQRAWNKEQTVKFMKTKKNQPDFDASEPEFLISCLDRHADWATIICLVGGGQEINTGEAGISEWLRSIAQRFQNWEVHISPNLTDSEYRAVEAIQELSQHNSVVFHDKLHLSVSMRSFRAEKVSAFVKSLLDLDTETCAATLSGISQNYPIVLTRDLTHAKGWLREKARGSERYGIVVSSQAQRLKPLAIDVKSPMNPIHWFLNGKDDVRSSFYLEDVATEFHIQGLELDWSCVTWDGDLRYDSSNKWKTYSFVGDTWNNIHKDDRKKYLINAYRVLLTRARQGMVIVVPEGSSSDPTRNPEYYNGTFEYLKRVGLKVLE